MVNSKKYVDNSWDFKTANTKENTHCYHNYPAMMIPQVAQRLIALYGANSQKLFDPYCGTGTSLVEASLHGINAIGTDLNPMARLIAEAKTTLIELQVLDLYLKEFNNFCFSLRFGIAQSPAIVAPQFTNIDFWFKKDTQEALTLVQSFIRDIHNTDIRKFFLVAFSETVRECSLTRNSEFKLYRMPERQRESFTPDVFGTIQAKLARNRAGLKGFIERKIGKTQTHVYGFNTSENIGTLDRDSIDIVLTSPPYGDSRTTVAYGQFSRLSNQWLGIENAGSIDKCLMGGKIRSIQKTGQAVIDKTIDQLAHTDEKRAREVYSFYDDYAKSIANVATVLKKGGYACYVVGNRRVKGITLPTDEITRCLFQAQGFEHTKTVTRSIPNKRMPSKNSPTNEKGKTSTTMNKEYIVVMQKV